jgi:hypothetical protein
MLRYTAAVVGSVTKGECHDKKTPASLSESSKVPGWGSGCRRGDYSHVTAEFRGGCDKIRSYNS